jgi:hypothetical protein
MNQPGTLSFNEILSTTKRISFSSIDLDEMRVFMNLKALHKPDLDLKIDSSIYSPGKMLWQGLLWLSSSDLNRDFLFVNVDSRRGLLSKQTAQIRTYTSDHSKNEFHPGPVVGNLLRGLVDINDLYRSKGIFKGTMYD